MTKTVATENMGKGITYNIEKKQYEVSFYDEWVKFKSDTETRLTNLESPCTVKSIVVGSHTISNTDNIIVCTGGTITFPDGLQEGRSWTIIQSTASDVTLSGSNLVAPMDGSLKLAGENSVVTVVKTADNKLRVFGITE